LSRLQPEAASGDEDTSVQRRKRGSLAGCEEALEVAAVPRGDQATNLARKRFGEEVVGAHHGAISKVVAGELFAERTSAGMIMQTLGHKIVATGAE
jgi:hypothetical protein